MSPNAGVLKSNAGSTTGGEGRCKSSQKDPGVINVDGNQCRFQPKAALKGCGAKPPARLPFVDVVLWDARRLPLRADCVDAVVTDMPFGKKHGSRTGNMALYPAVLQQIHRVLSHLPKKLSAGAPSTVATTVCRGAPAPATGDIFFCRRNKMYCSLNQGGYSYDCYCYCPEREECRCRRLGLCGRHRCRRKCRPPGWATKRPRCVADH